MNTADVHSAGAPPKKKRALPFKRTAPRKPSVDPDEDNDLDFFRHSKEVFPEILREVEEEIAERARMTTPENNHRKRRNSSPDEENGEAQKRPSFSDSRQPEASRKSLAVNDSDEDDCILDIKGKGKEIVRPSRIVTSRKTRSSPTATASPTIEVIPNRDDEFIPTKTPYRKEISSLQHTTRSSGLKEEEDTDSDIEEVESWEPTPVEETWDEHQVWIQKAREVQARAQDAVTYVLVSSIIPGTTPVFLRRRLRQDMQVIIDTWADKQRANGIDFGADKQKLFLTWKGFKIYNKSSLASLGVKVNDEGEVKYGQGEGWRSWRRQPAMHLEIWTEDAYAEWEKAKEHERALRYGIIDDEDSDTGSLQEQAPAPAKKGIKVVLKAKDLEPMKSSIQEDTTVEFMIEAFRQQRDLDEEWDVAIFFDGERLDEDSLVKDADIDPDESNQFEVHVKKRG